MRDPAQRLGIAAELRQDLAAIEGSEQTHGSFSELMRAQSVDRIAFD
jgi:hypothetical protein